jgi:conjugative transposon TraN protein
VIIGSNQLPSDSITGQIVKLSSGINEAVFKSIAEKIESAKIKHVRKKTCDQIQLKVQGVYISQDAIFFRLQLKNKSNISYDVDEIHFSIKDKQKTQRIASQELELKSLYRYKPFNKIQADSSSSCVIVLPKFTLDDSKYLSIHVLERNGDRHFDLALGNKHISNAIKFE